MQYEVELKFPVPDVPHLAARLSQLHVQWAASEVQVDRYFAHPCRDFAQTDEALRIRTRLDGALLTYKGPKVDRFTKSRRELELSLGPADGVPAWIELLQALGFEPVAEVRKSRRPGHVAYGGYEVQVALDEVEGLGTFLELELPATDETLDARRVCLNGLAAELRLGAPERRSYLELLLETRGTRRP
jgi:adenylate cyclase class 2